MNDFPSQHSAPSTQSRLSEDDLDREARIDAFREVMCKATTASRKRLACAQMYAEIHNRTPAAVAWLEAQRGLRPADVPQRPVPSSVFRRSA